MVSVGWGYLAYNTSNTNVRAAQDWYLGLQWTDAFIKGNTFGMAVGQPTFVTAQTTGTPNDAGYAWEWWYKFQVSDHITVMPAVFYLSNPLGQNGHLAAGGDGSNVINNFGALVKTTFKF